MRVVDSDGFRPSRRDDRMHLWRQVLEQEGEDVVDGASFNEVIVVEDEDNPVGDGGDLVEQGGQKSLDRWWCGCICNPRGPGAQHAAPLPYAPLPYAPLPYVPIR